MKRKQKKKLRKRKQKREKIKRRTRTKRKRRTREKSKGRTGTKRKEEREKKEAEAKQLAEQAEASVQLLENNQIQDNIAPAQAAVEQVVDPTVKATLTERIGHVQNAINEKAKVEAQQAAAAQQAADQEQRTVYVAQYGKSSAYWYNIDNMPSNTVRTKLSQ